MTKYIFIEAFQGHRIGYVVFMMIIQTPSRNCYDDGTEY